MEHRTQVLATLVVALCALACGTQEAAELGAAERPGDEFLARPSSAASFTNDLDTMTNDWDRTIREQAVYNQNMMRKISRPRKPDGPVSYTKVPWFAMKAKAQTHPNLSFDDCELMCNKYNACRSFSYSLQKKICITSYQGMGYDPDFTFHSKKQDGDSQTAEYESFPGMKFQVSARVVRRGGSYSQCEYECSKAKEGCSGFTYSQRFRICMQTSEPIHYDNEFNYYEKTSLTSSEKRKVVEVKEVQKKQHQKNNLSDDGGKAEEEAIQRAVHKQKEVEQAEEAVEIEKQKAREANMKLEIASSRKARLVSKAKRLGLDAEKLVAQDQKNRAKKELDQKKQAQGRRTGDGAESDEAEVEVEADEKQQSELEEEEAANNEAVQEIQIQVEAASKKKTEAEINQSETLKKEQQGEEKATDDKLEDRIASMEEKLVAAKRVRHDELLAEREQRTKERLQKHDAADVQLVAERRAKRCVNEKDPYFRKEVCAKSTQDAKKAKADALREQAVVDISISDKSDEGDTTKKIRGYTKKLKRLRKRLQAVEEKQRAKRFAEEVGEKKQIRKETHSKHKEFMERKRILQRDQEEAAQTQVLEVKSKQAQIEDLKQHMANQQKIARQERVNKAVNRKFNAAYRMHLAKGFKREETPTTNLV
jgi:colicin import membrane protein